MKMCQKCIYWVLNEEIDVHVCCNQNKLGEWTEEDYCCEEFIQE